jgi:2,4-dienoyl-CoA reductase-like NADH-dependent reductase (Old Yellow Enzyme family)
LGGRRALPPGADPWETIAPSPIPFGPNWHVPRVATLEDIARVREAFVNSAKRAVRIGFDAIELHYAHGYLAHSFLSPVSNHRTDQYGGSLENRMRFGLEIAKAVRTAVPKRHRARRGLPSDGARTGHHHRERVAFRRRSRPAASTSSILVGWHHRRHAQSDDPATTSIAER